ncbi:GMC oxidoreductase-domain-containing protein [Aspergillus pseudoustus]|uniref:GMC oxidoreductase-domain-containing protein n=1 Tax=Aspergillus pseudoustus TaxID=1810923 RepID=A0ABR4JYZ2_9EURO
MARDPAVAAAAMAAYQKDGSGPLGMVGLVSAFMPCVDFPESEREHTKFYEIWLIDPAEPTAQFVLAPFQLLPRAGTRPKDLFSTSHPGFFISLVSLSSYPFSRGSVHISTSDPTAAPVIDSGILRHAADLELQARHSKWMEKIAETEAMASLPKPGGQRLHTPREITTVQQAEELCKELVLSMYHVCGSCAMMPREDGGVLDSHLRVYGTSNVRVVDASAFPLVPRGNIQTTVFAVAERAADIIRQGLGQ